MPAMDVCSASPPVNTFNQFSLDFVQILCHWGIPEILNFQLSKINNNDTEKVRNCEVVERLTSCAKAQNSLH